jgi:hypothetical protein
VVVYSALGALGSGRLQEGVRVHVVTLDGSKVWVAAAVLTCCAVALS